MANVETVTLRNKAGETIICNASDAGRFPGFSAGPAEPVDPETAVTGDGTGTPLPPIEDEPAPTKRKRGRPRKG